MTTTFDLSNYLDDIKLQMGDSDGTAWEDDWLHTSLIASVEALQRWWNYRYLIDDDDAVYRNPNTSFLFAEPPVIERGDKRPIILMASIILKSGDLENRAWNLGSWRDSEISYSNIESGRRKTDSIVRDWNELVGILKPPQKVLSYASKLHLPGYVRNSMEFKKLAN